jgi:hypothetical protein
LIGGALNDHIGPHAIWIGGLLIGLTSVLGLLLLNGLGWYRQPAPLPSET